MADKVDFELVSPERILLSTQSEMVVIPAADGDLAVMAGHQPLIATLRPGIIEVFVDDKVHDRLFVAGGFAEFSNERLTVLAEEAMPVADLDRARIEQRLKDAREDLDDAKDDETRARVQKQIDQLLQTLDVV
jgi:F-type H+-transporting ATPase subunit epsilon